MHGLSNTEEHDGVACDDLEAMLSPLDREMHGLSHFGLLIITRHAIMLTNHQSLKLMWNYCQFMCEFHALPHIAAPIDYVHSMTEFVASKSSTRCHTSLAMGPRVSIATSVFGWSPSIQAI